MTGRIPAPPIPSWLESQLPFDRYLIGVEDGLRMHVMEQGHGRPVLLFHGNPTWGYLYRNVAANLVEEPFRLIMPDLVGLGFSDRPASKSDHTLLNHSGWVSSLLDQLDLTDAVVVAQDWGGPIGVHAVSQRKGLMAGLVVMNTMLDAPKPGFKPTSFHRFFSSALGGVVAGPLGMLHRRLGLAQSDRKSISGTVQKSYNYPLRRSREAIVALVRMVPDTMDHPSVGALGEVGEFVKAFKGPSAIVWGENDPVLGRLLRRTMRQLPHAEVTETSAGHFLPEEVPSEIAAAIKSVVARSS